MNHSDALSRPILGHRGLGYRGLGHRGLALGVAALFAAPVAYAQHADPEEFIRLEPVLQRALDRAAPFTVTVETFGGTRRNMGKAGPMDGVAPPSAASVSSIRNSATAPSPRSTATS